MMALGSKNQIPVLLERRGWTVYRLSQETGLTYDAVAQLVKADTIPPRTYWVSIKKVARALGVSESDLEV